MVLCCRDVKAPDVSLERLMVWSTQKHDHEVSMTVEFVTDGTRC